jgi:LytS/YehU family sensor histidine kinase
VNTEFCHVYDYFNIRINGFYAFVTILAITLLILEANRLAEKFILTRVSRENFNIRFPVIFFISGSIISTILATLIVTVVGVMIHSFSIKENIIPLKLNLTYAWLVNLLYHLLNTIIFYFKQYTFTRIEAEELKRFQTQAELQLVKSQVNPHFLFNNLNVLSTLVIQNNGEANRFIEEFSKVYRYILNNHHKELVELSTELYYINPYIFLLKKRFGDGLNVEIDIPGNYGNYLVIPAALQMLIENAIKHNIVSKQKPLHISLMIKDKELVVVTNNLQVKKTVEYSSEIGLKNIMKRYSIVSNREVHVNIDEAVFSVELPLIHPN